MASPQKVHNWIKTNLTTTTYDYKQPLARGRYWNKLIMLKIWQSFQKFFKPLKIFKIWIFIRNYNWTHWNDGQCGLFWHENFGKFEMFSTSTGSWIRSRRKRDRFQLPVEVENISNLPKLSCQKGTGLSVFSMGSGIVALTVPIEKKCKQNTIRNRFHHSAHMFKTHCERHTRSLMNILWRSRRKF